MRIYPDTEHQIKTINENSIIVRGTQRKTINESSILVRGMQKIVNGIADRLWKRAEKALPLVINGTIESTLDKKSRNIYKEDMNEGISSFYRSLIDKLYVIGASSLFIVCLVCAGTTTNQMRVLITNFVKLDERYLDDFRYFFKKIGIQAGVVFILYKIMKKIYPHVLKSLANVVGRHEINNVYINRIFDARGGKLYPKRKEKFIIIRDEVNSELFICWRSGKWYPEVPVHLFSADALEELPKLVGKA